MRSPRALLTSLAFLAVVATACGGGTPGTSSAASPDRTSGTAAAPTSGPASDGGTSSPSAPSSVDQLWAFQAEQVAGGAFEGSSLSGRDVAVWFWAPW